MLPQVIGRASPMPFIGRASPMSFIGRASPMSFTICNLASSCQYGLFIFFRSEYCRIVKLKYCLESDADWAKEFRRRLGTDSSKGGFRSKSLTILNISTFCLSLSISLWISIKVKSTTMVKGETKAPFSIATTPRCREGCYSIPWIALLILDWYLYNAEYKQASRTFFFFFLVWLDLGLNLGLPDHWQTLSLLC